MRLAASGKTERQKGKGVSCSLSCKGATAARPAGSRSQSQPHAQTKNTLMSASADRGEDYEAKCKQVQRKIKEKIF